MSKSSLIPTCLSMRLGSRFAIACTASGLAASNFISERGIANLTYTDGWVHAPVRVRRMRSKRAGHRRAVFEKTEARPLRLENSLEPSDTCNLRS